MLLFLALSCATHFDQPDSLSSYQSAFDHADSIVVFGMLGEGFINTKKPIRDKETIKRVKEIVFGGSLKRRYDKQGLLDGTTTLATAISFDVGVCRDGKMILHCHFLATKLVIFDSREVFQDADESKFFAKEVRDILKNHVFAKRPRRHELGRENPLWKEWEPYLKD